jgi:hypothetical protein
LGFLKAGVGFDLIIRGFILGVMWTSIGFRQKS